MLELPIENSPQWLLAVDMLNLFVENEVTHWLNPPTELSFSQFDLCQGADHFLPGLSSG